MSIQILGLREYVDKKTGETRKKDAFFNNFWRAETVREILLNIDHYVEQIPSEERYNLYYTAASCLEKIGRVFQSQEIIPFDIDDISEDDLERTDEYIQVVCDTLGVSRSHIGIVFSGNGLQFLVGLKEPITYEEYFKEMRVFYKAVCGDITQALFMAGLSGEADTSVWSPARLLRLPNTKNIKPNKPHRTAFVINGEIIPLDFDIMEKSNIPVLEVGEDFISERMYSKLPAPDPKGVQEGCDFLKYCYENPNDISEPQWYALLSIIGWLKDGRDLAHEYSRGYDNYIEEQTDRKLDQALKSSGPRTCDNISTLWDGCPACPNYGKCKSPIQITSKEYIKTKETGFHDIVRDADGIEKARRPNYNDLAKFFELQHPYITHQEGKMTFIWEEGVWYDVPRVYMEAFAEEHFEPKPLNRVVSEFVGKILRNNLRSHQWFKNHQGFINFNNGILDMSTREILAHDPSFSFRYKLPFDYDPYTICPQFEKYLNEVTLGDEEIKCVLLEYMGYALAGIESSFGEKALILTGDGSNGKSVFLDLLKYMAGEGNYSTLSMGQEINKLENRYQLDGKLFNVSEETPDGGLLDSSIFKAIVTGGEVQARKLYCDAYSMRTNAKIIMACNRLPATNDDSHGMIRRLLIVPFRATFNKDTRDPHIREKLYQEASGILNLVLKHLDKLIERESFTEAEISERYLREYQMDNNPILQWFNEAAVASPGKFTTLKEAYKRYRMDSEENGQRPYDIRVFGKKIRHILTEERVKKKRVNGSPVLCIMDFELTEQYQGTGDF